MTFASAPLRHPVVAVGPPRGQRRNLDDNATPLIPMRPLTVTEAMDAAFLIVRCNARAMIGLPVVVVLVGLAVALLLGVAWLWIGQLGAQMAQNIMLVLVILAVGATFPIIMYWLQGMLTRASLQIVMGETPAPPSRAKFAEGLRMIGPMIAIMIEQTMALSIALSIAQTVIGLLLIATLPAIASLPVSIAPVSAVVVAVSLFLLGGLVGAFAYAWLALTIPIYLAEGPSAPMWIGKPRTPTNVLNAMGRSFALPGIVNVLRIAWAFALGVVGMAILSLLVSAGAVLALNQYLQALAIDLSTSVDTLYLAVSGTLSTIVFIVSLAYFCALQTVFYLDIRMRREALDLDVRFPSIGSPQPKGSM